MLYDDKEPISVEVAQNEIFKDYLDADEQILGVFKPNKKRYYQGYWMFFIPVFWPHLLLCTVFTVGFFPFISAKKGYENAYYAYTNKRLISRSGAFGITYHSIEYKDVITTEANESFFDRKTGTGSLYFRAQHQGVGFRNISRPYEVLRTIREIIAQNS